MILSRAGWFSSRSYLLGGIARRSHQTHAVNISHPPSGGVAPFIKPEVKSRGADQKEEVSAAPIKATTSTSGVGGFGMRIALAKRLQSLSVENAIHPSIRDPSAECSMRMTQALSPNVMENLSPTFRRFALQEKVAIVTG